MTRNSISKQRKTYCIDQDISRPLPDRGSLVLADHNNDCNHISEVLKQNVTHFL